MAECNSGPVVTIRWPLDDQLMGIRFGNAVVYGKASDITIRVRTGGVVGSDDG